MCLETNFLLEYLIFLHTLCSPVYLLVSLAFLLSYIFPNSMLPSHLSIKLTFISVTLLLSLPLYIYILLYRVIYILLYSYAIWFYRDYNGKNIISHRMHFFRSENIVLSKSRRRICQWELKLDFLWSYLLFLHFNVTTNEANIQTLKTERNGRKYFFNTFFKLFPDYLWTTSTNIMVTDSLDIISKRLLHWWNFEVQKYVKEQHFNNNH